MDMDRSLEGVTVQLALNVMILEHLLCQKVIKNAKNDGDVSEEHRWLENAPPSQIWDKLNTK